MYPGRVVPRVDIVSKRQCRLIECKVDLYPRTIALESILFQRCNINLSSVRLIFTSKQFPQIDIVSKRQCQFIECKVNISPKSKLSQRGNVNLLSLKLIFIPEQLPLSRYCLKEAMLVYRV